MTSCINFLLTMARQKQRKVYEEDEDFKVRIYLRINHSNLNQFTAHFLCTHGPGNIQPTLRRGSDTVHVVNLYYISDNTEFLVIQDAGEDQQDS